MNFFGTTNVGKVRKQNEDFFQVDDGRKIVIVADGVGGHHHGEIASKLAVESCYYSLTEEEPLENSTQKEKAISNSLKFANEKVITLQENNAQYKKMGTTLTCFHIFEDTVYYAYIGDSRLYWINTQQACITQLTADHTLDPDKIDREKSPALHKKAGSILTKVIGSFLLLSPDSGYQRLQKGDFLLACTDGLSDLVSDELILDYVLQNGNDLKSAAKQLIDKALDYGGRDNITLVLGQLSD